MDYTTAVAEGGEGEGARREEEEGHFQTSVAVRRDAETMPASKKADEADFRWFPPVENMDHDSDRTFEALNGGLASLWSSRARPPSRCSQGAGESAAKCLANSSSGNGPGTAFAVDNNTRNGNHGHSSIGDNGGRVFETRPSATGSTCSNADRQPGVRPDGLSTPALEPQLLFLVRHGETDMNLAGRLQGRGVNAHLNGNGLMQAEELGRFVRNVPFDTVTSSSLHRAHETAMRVAEQNTECLMRAQENGKPERGGRAAFCEPKGDQPATQADFCCGDRAQVRVRKLDGLDELSWGELEGHDSSQEPWKSKLAELKAGWDAGHFDRAAEGGESLLEVEARSRVAVEACLDMDQHLNLVVSHGRTLRVVMLSLSGLGLDQINSIGKIPNSGLYVVEARQSAPGQPRSYRLLTPNL